MDDKSRKGHAALLLMGPSEHDEPDGDEGGGDAEDMATDEVAEAIGGDVDKPRLKAALKAFVQACMKAEEKGEYGE